MNKPRTYQTAGIVIKKTRLGEADRILTIFTPGMGKIQGMAKAARKTRSKLGGHLELLTYSQLTLARGKNLDTIIGSQTIDAFLAVKNDLELISCACYLAELVAQFTVDDTADAALFALLLDTLQHLPGASRPALLLRHFEIHLLRHAGYRPELEKCVLCRRPVASTPGGFSPSAGGILCRECQSRSHHYGYPLSAGCLACLRLLQAGPWETVAAGPLDEETLDSLELLTRRYIRYLLERDVKSVAWLECLKNRPV